MQAAGITGVRAVVLLLELLAGEHGLLGVDDDDKVTAVNVRSVVGLELAAQQISSERCGLAHRLAGCIQNVPLAGDGVLVQQSSGHIRASNLNVLKNILTFFRRERRIGLTFALIFYTTIGGTCQRNFDLDITLLSKSPFFSVLRSNSQFLFSFWRSRYE